MKRFLIILTVLLLSSQVIAEGVKKYGESIELKEKTELSTILSNLEKFEGKKVLVEGTVVGVCAKRGCWIDLSNEKGEKLRVKVNDGEIVFPMEAKGKKALVEGEIFSVVIEGEGCGGDCEGEKENDKEKCEHSKEVKKVYMLKGIGAEIK